MIAAKQRQMFVCVHSGRIIILATRVQTVNVKTSSQTAQHNLHAIYWGTMKLRKRSSIAVGATLIAGIVFYICLPNQRPSMPVFEGKTAQQWFFGPNAQSNARLAMYGMGTNCVPYLLEKAVMSDSMLKKSWYWFWTKLPKRFRPGTAVAPGYIQNLAWSHLATWAQESDYMAPEILAAIKRVESDENRYRALQAMTSGARRVPRADRALHYVSFLEDPDYMIRFEAAVQLAHLTPSIRSTNLVPILLNAATNTAFLEQRVFENSSANVQMPTNVMQSLIQNRQVKARHALRQLKSY